MKHMTVADYAHMLARGTAFSQSNWGDGEWSAVLGVEGQNCDGHEYLPDLGRDLRAALVNPMPHMHGTNPGARLAAQVDKWISDHGGLTSVRWVPKEVLSDANLSGELYPVLAALRGRNVIQVGPPHLHELPRDVLPSRKAFIAVPPINCYRVIDQTVSTLHRVLRHGDVALFSASMATNVMIRRLYPMWGAKVTMLDMGAIFDPYCGVWSRKMYRVENNPELLANLKRNVGGYK